MHSSRMDRHNHYAPESSSEPLRVSDGEGSASVSPMPTTAAERLKNWQKQSLKTLSRMKIPFKIPSLIDRSQPYFSGIARFGVVSFWNLINDPFHTLLNMPWGRFVMLFFGTYFVEFLIFAVLFYVQGDACILGMDGKFAHALWLSSRTASTLGYNQITPNPECHFTNFCVMVEVIASSLVNFIMLGMVFARFSAPFKRASSVRFSQQCVCHSHESGYWSISMRVANLRKHQILQPSIRMVMTAVDSITPSNYMFEHLKLESAYQQETNLELGFPANIVHVIRPDSFLYNLSLTEMDTRMMEVLVFVDGIDAMTSKHMSARFSYPSSEILLNQVHVPLNLEMRGKKLGLNFNDFDRTVSASAALEAEMQLREQAGASSAPPNAAVAAAAAGAEATASAGWQLKHQTFKRLAERYGTLPRDEERRNQRVAQHLWHTSGGGLDGSPSAGEASGLNKHRSRMSNESSQEITVVGEVRRDHVSLYVGSGGGRGAGDGRTGQEMSAEGASAFSNFSSQLKQGQADSRALEHNSSSSRFLLGDDDDRGHGRGGFGDPLLNIAVQENGLPELYQPPVTIGSTGMLSAELAASAPHLADSTVAGLAPYAVPASALAASSNLKSLGPNNDMYSIAKPSAPPQGAALTNPFTDLNPVYSPASLRGASVGGVTEFPTRSNFGSGASSGGNLPLSSGANEPVPLPQQGGSPSTKEL